MHNLQHHIQRYVLGLTFLQSHTYKWMYLALLMSDILALSLALSLSMALRQQIFGSSGAWDFFTHLLPALLTLAILIYTFQGLYTVGGIDPVQELRTISLGTSLVFLLLTALTFFTQTADIYSRLVFLFTWGFTLFLTPVSRFALRTIASRFNIWGEPVLVLGYGAATRKIVNYLTHKSQLGWRPLAIIGGHPQQKPLNGQQPPYFYAQSEAQLQSHLDRYKAKTLIVVRDETPATWIQQIHQPSSHDIRKIVVVSAFGDNYNTIIKTHNIAGALGLEVQQNLLTPTGQLAKRGLDLILSTFLAIPALTISGIVALLIKIDSPGAVLYKQHRVGYKGTPFVVWKFRTMVEDSDQILQTYLEAHPHSQMEWEATQKLRDDPRITHVGAFLRKTSLDELPQLWNVIRGEMSIVGPRPCMPEQTPLYGKIWDLYISVRPGITGLWQVSGRNNTTYEERVYYDGYYVQNWSIWLDIYILVKTIWTVISRDGAY